MFLAASLYPLFHPRADSTLLALPLSSLSLPFFLSLSLSPLLSSRSSLVLSRFIILSSSSYAHIVRSVSSHEITLSPSLSLFPLLARYPIRTYPPSCSYPCLIPSRPVHARASNAECHAYPFCVRAIDTRGKLSLVSSFCNDPVFSRSARKFPASYGLDYVQMEYEL